MLCCLRPPRFLLRHSRFFCSASNSASDMDRYRRAFARRMEMAGLKPHHRIALGVSGGADSMALCVLTAEWKSRNIDAGTHKESSVFIDGLLGIIVDHKLRPESTEEANWVRDTVSKIGIKCQVECCDWPEGLPKQGHLEEAARDMRYKIFQDVCVHHQIGALLVAHHADDQAEVFILRLSRNSGVLGLAGMAFVSQLFPRQMQYFSADPSGHGILLIRPMLDFHKEDMYKICQGGHLDWVEDPTNQSSLFARNRIRMLVRKLSCEEAQNGTFKSELQSLISVCRLTRSFVEHACHHLTKKSVTIMDHGYAVIDVQKLNPSNIEDICLSRLLTHVLQFVSQKNKPVRGGALKLSMDYIRNFPIKTALTVAGCYLCPAPGSKGTKALVCCSPDLAQDSSLILQANPSTGEVVCRLLREINEITMNVNFDANIPVDSLDIPFLKVQSAKGLLKEAKNIKIINESTSRSVISLQMQENIHFYAKKEVASDLHSGCTKRSASTSTIPLQSGQLCDFMSRFLLVWKFCENPTQDGCSPMFANFKLNINEEGQRPPCESCNFQQERLFFVRPMVDADWLYLGNVTKSQLLDERDINPVGIKHDQNTLCSLYMRSSAERALCMLKSIPLAARRALPVLVDSQGLLLSVPSICFQRCPCLSIVALYRPRVPLGRGSSLYT